MSKLGIAQVGCGDIAHIRYFYSYPKLKDRLELVGLYDMNRAFMDQTAAELGVKAYDSWQQLLDDPAVKAVVVTTYHPSHAQYVIEALEAGKQVLCEKPICTNTQDTERIRKTVNRTGGIFMALPDDAYPHVDTVKQMIQSGVIGEVNSADGVFAHQGPLHAPWFFDKKLAEWGVLADLGVYPISMFTYLFGPVDTVYGKTVMLQKERVSLKGEPIKPSVEDSAAVIMSWENGMQATLRTNWCTAADKSVCFWDFRIYGSKGVIYINFSDEAHRVVVFSPYAKLEGEAIEYLGFGDNYVIKTDTSDLNVDIVEAFLDAVESNTPIADGGCSIARQAHVIEIIQSVYESSKSGQEKKIKTRF
ncbi:Gfo/Idh/MocA family oxidoreductase [Eubacteriales bacterium OttesenSCG-928-N13]|nr:Gfo/Idh/MocA family oxidoreductase [Eubacteriales bacterium OttesenSCG-928-N13]